MNALTLPATRSSIAIRAITLKISAIVMFQVMAALVKALGDDYPVGQLIFARSAFALIPLAVLIYADGGLKILATAKPRAHLGRTVAGMCAMVCGFTALSLIPFANAVAIGFAATLFTTVLATLLLGEKLRIYRISAVVVGFVGVVVMLSRALQFDQGSAMFWGSTLALAGSLFVAFATISIRHLAHSEPPAAIIFYFTAACTIAGALTLPFAYRVPDALDALLLVAIGIFGGFGQILMTNAYRLGQANLLAPFDYTAMVFAVLIGLVIFGEMPTVTVLAGSAIVIAAGLFIFERERRLGLRRGAARARGVAPGTAR
ncbi:MAG: DMT family transporter [Geminicoccaceae bacterium]